MWTIIIIGGILILMTLYGIIWYSHSVFAGGVNIDDPDIMKVEASILNGTYDWKGAIKKVEEAEQICIKEEQRQLKEWEIKQQEMADASKSLKFPDDGRTYPADNNPYNITYMNEKLDRKADIEALSDKECKDFVRKINKMRAKKRQPIRKCPNMR